MSDVTRLADQPCLTGTSSQESNDHRVVVDVFDVTWEDLLVRSPSSARENVNYWLTTKIVVDSPSTCRGALNEVKWYESHQHTVAKPLTGSENVMTQLDASTYVTSSGMTFTSEPSTTV